MHHLNASFSRNCSLFVQHQIIISVQDQWHFGDWTFMNKLKWNFNQNAQIDGLVKGCSISIANALEILQSCTKAKCSFKKIPWRCCLQISAILFRGKWVKYQQIWKQLLNVYSAFEHVICSALQQTTWLLACPCMLLHRCWKYYRWLSARLPSASIWSCRL